VVKEDGFFALYSGLSATVARAMLLNGCQFGVYSQAKEVLIEHTPLRDGPDMPSKLSLQFVGSIISSFFAAGASTPADVMKSRLQNQKIVDGKPMYSGLGDCMAKLVKSEGVLAFWKGFTPAWVKLAPHTIISFIILEQLSSIVTGENSM
jgi:solute carrier family 25 oxoglutarate transporter 11